MENNENILELPKELDNNSNNKNKKIKKSHLFSTAIFKESFKSHIKGASIVGIANAGLIAVVIGILSTLNINSTSTSMKNLFSNASSETTIKEGAVSYYNAYYKGALAYDNLNDSINSVETLIATPINLIEREDVKTLIGSFIVYYEQVYLTTQNKEVALSQTITASEAYIDSYLTDVDESTKGIFKVLVKSYLSYYSNDNTLTYKDIMIKIMPSIYSSIIVSNLSLDESINSKLVSLFSNAIEYYYNTDSLSDTKSKYSFELAKLLSNDEDAIYLINSLEESYNLDPEAYDLNLDNYKEKLIKDIIVDKVYSTLLDSAYYSYLPDFDVYYKTSELGYPVTLVDTGKKDNNGNIIYEEKEVKEYDPSLFIEVSKGMSTKASSLEKRRKAIITGVPYTSSEVETAKKEAEESVKLIKDSLDNFLSIYLVRDNNVNEYHNEEGIIESKVITKSINDIIDYASISVVEDYNKKYNKDIKNIYEITASNDSSSGAYLVNKMYSYASGAISSYKEIYSKKVNDGYSEEDASLIAINVSTIGVMDEIPNKVSNNLKEMGDMNIYGIIVGSIGFAMACLLIPLVYSIMLSNDLVCKKVENGSLAFTFSTPIKRSTFIFTEATFLVFVETCLAILLTGVALIARRVGIELGSTDIESSITIEMLLKLGLGNYLVTLALSGICFFTSSLFNKTSTSIGIGGGISIFFFICSILGLFGSESFPSFIRIDSMNYFNYVTIITFFDTNAVITNNDVYYYKLIGLVAITLITYLSSFIVFKKKDLPL